MHEFSLLFEVLNCLQNLFVQLTPVCPALLFLRSTGLFVVVHVGHLFSKKNLRKLKF